MRIRLHRYRYSSEGTVTGATLGSPTGTLTGEPATGSQDDGQGNESQQQQPDPTKLQAELERWKRQARENETRAKANADAARKLAEIEDSTKSDTERLTAKSAKLEADLGSAQGEVARLTAAIKHGLGFEDLVLLPKGLSVEETESAAKLLAERIQGSGRQQDPPSFDGGTRGTPAAGGSFDSTVRDALRNRRR
jgi:hypothetical protein